VKGFGALQNLSDLLAKLRHNFARVEQDPSDSYAAFDFFVTAEHMIDWGCPGYANRDARESLRRSSVLLQVVSHIASGSKHFVAEARRHESVQHADTVGGSFDPGVRPDGLAVGTLYVAIEGAAANILGARVGVVELASRVLRFWEGEVERQRLTGGGRGGRTSR